jgi:hypothetical protein
MPAKLNTLHPMWEKFRGLQTFYEFSHLVTECNKGSDDSYGEWFYAPAGRLDGNIAVIYSGSWDEERPRDDPASTYADLFHMSEEEDAVEYTHRLQHWQGQSEYDEQPD